LHRCSTTLIKIALDRAFSHLLVREHAKLSVLNLVKSGHVALAPAIFDAVLNANMPRLPRIPKNGERRDHMQWEDTRERRFEFSPTDTIQHWYNPILQLFPTLRKQDLLDELEYWIVDKWAAPPKAHWWDNEPRKGRFDERRFGLWSSHHGSLPTVERFGIYLEWQAMCCAVGRLMESHPVVERSEDYDSFENWFSASLLTRPPAWLADLRDATPLLESLWSAGEQKDGQWAARIPKAAFLSALLPVTTGASFITLAGIWTAAFPKREIQVHISSGLVTPETGTPLLRSLQLAARPYGFGFPSDDDDRGQIEDPPYVLRAIVRDIRHDEGLDRKDPLRHGISSSEHRPGSAIITVFDLQQEALPAKEWRHKGDLAFRCVEWSDSPEDDEDWSPGRRVTKTDGKWFQMDVDLLHKYLQLQKMDLIASIFIERRIEREYGRAYEREIKKKKLLEKVLILRSNGEIEDINGRIGTWRKARKRVRRK
jgi:hypothetical protein